MEQDRTQFAVLILYVYSTGCDEMGDYFAIESDTMIDIVCEVTVMYLNKVWFCMFIFKRNAY